MKPRGMSFEPFRAVTPPKNSPSTASLDKVSFICLHMSLTGSSRAPWRYWMVQMMLSCLNMTSHSHLTIANWNASSLSPIRDGSSQCIYRCSWRAAPLRYDSSKWFIWQTLLLSCLNMTSHSQLRIANSGTSCLPPLDDRSFKCLQRSSWWAVAGRHEGSE